MKFATGFLKMNFIIFTLLDGVDHCSNVKSVGSCCRHGSDYKCMQDLAENPDDM